MFSFLRRRHDRQRKERAMQALRLQDLSREIAALTAEYDNSTARADRVANRIKLLQDEYAALSRSMNPP